MVGGRVSETAKFVLAACFVVAVVGGAIAYAILFAKPSSQENGFFTPLPPPGRVDLSPLPSLDANLSVHQGELFAVNATVHSYPNQTDLTVKLSLTVESFRNRSRLAFNLSASPSSSGDSWVWPEHPFDITIEPNPVVLEPDGEALSVLTIRVAEDAPTGLYSLYLRVKTSVPSSYMNYVLYLTVLQKD